MDGGNGEQNSGCTCGGGSGGGCGCGIGGCVGGGSCRGAGHACANAAKQCKARNKCPDVDCDEDPNIEEYLMSMKSISECSKGKNELAVVPQTEPVDTEPVVETVEKVISPGVTMCTTRITEEDPCSGKKATMHTSHILNKKTGTLISVQRTDYTGGCPNKDNELKYSSPGSIMKR